MGQIAKDVQLILIHFSDYKCNKNIIKHNRKKLYMNEYDKYLETNKK